MKNALLLWKTLGLTAMIAIAPIALAQNLPAGVGGYWKITKMYPKKPIAAPGCTANPEFFSKMARGSRVLMSDRNIVWGGASATDPGARVSMVDPGEFSAHHSESGVTMHELSLDRGSKVEVITLSAPGAWIESIRLAASRGSSGMSWITCLAMSRRLIASASASTSSVCGSSRRRTFAFR